MNKFLLLLATVFVAALTHAQTNKTTTILQTDSTTRIEISTTVNGVTTIEQLEGDQAREYLESKDGKFIDIKISKQDVDAVETELKAIGSEIDQLLKEMELGINTALRKVEQEINESIDCKKQSSGKVI